MQLTFFCGSAPECRQSDNRQALNIAKYNSEIYYSVIGLTEKMNSSLSLLEKKLPNYFYNFLNLYLKNTVNEKMNPKKKSISMRARIKLEKKLQLDMEFYEFVQQRFNNEIKRLNIVL